MNSRKYKGFVNRGTNTCYLNSSIQILFHLESFRERFRNWECPLIRDCLSCELGVIFQQYMRPRGVVLRAHSLQNLLCDLYAERGTFERGEQADGMEALGALLLGVHCASLQDESQGVIEEFSSIPCEDCPSHQVFYLPIVQELRCECGAVNVVEWDKSNYMQPCYTQGLLQKSTQKNRGFLKKKYDELLRYKRQSDILPFIGSFNSYIREFLYNQNIPFCAGALQNCEFKRSSRFVRILEPPKVLLINMIWSLEEPITTDAIKLIASLNSKISIRDIYQTEFENEYILKAFMMYGYGHYVAYVFDCDEKYWVKLDDIKTTKLESLYQMIQDMCNHYLHPVGVVYQESFDGFTEEPLTEIYWLELEKWGLEFDVQYQEELEKLQKTNKEQNQRKQEENKFIFAWNCECGKKNPDTFLVCPDCKTKKPGQEVWVCSHCTMANPEYQSYCTVCGENRHPKRYYLRSQSKKELQYWTCYCGEEKNTKEYCSKCQHHQSKLKYCHQCNKVLNQQKWCSKCYNEIRSEGFCVACLGSDRGAICQDCFSSSWKCKFCKKRTNQSVCKCGNR